MVKFQPLLLSALLCLCLSNNSFAQNACSGGFGDPIFTETFGSGADGTRADISGSGSTTYTFDPGDGSSPITADGQIDDEEYTLYSGDPFDLNNGWHQGTDHTGDTDGNMAVFNASFDPGVFYSRDVLGLCPGTRMQFSAWIANILDPGNQNDTPPGNSCIGDENDDGILPNITFSIYEQGTTNLLGSTNTGLLQDTSTGLIWNQYTFELNLPVGISDVTVELSNSQAGGCGNDLAIDDIEFRACGPMAEITSPPIVICAGVPVTLTASIGDGYNPPNFQWQFFNEGTMTWENVGPAGPAALSYEVPDPKNGDRFRYLAAGDINSLSNPNCNIVSDEFIVETVDLSASVTGVGGTQICIGDGAKLIATVPAGTDVDGLVGTAPYTFVWKDPDGTILATVSGNTSGQDSITVNTLGFEPPNNIWMVELTDDNGCTDTADVEVIFDPDCPLPIELVSFNGEWLQNGNAVSLKWKTANEMNSAYFMIEKSQDGRMFQRLSKIEAAGLSNDQKEYGFIDENSVNSKDLYYRLKQVDQDGSFEYSKIVHLTNNITDRLYVSQQNGLINIHLQNDQAQTIQQLIIYDSLGKLVQEMNNLFYPTGRHIITFDPSALNSGTYFVNVQTNNYTKTLKIIHF